MCIKLFQKFFDQIKRDTLLIKYNLLKTKHKGCNKDSRERETLRM